MRQSLFSNYCHVSLKSLVSYCILKPHFRQKKQWAQCRNSVGANYLLQLQACSCGEANRISRAALNYFFFFPLWNVIIANERQTSQYTLSLPLPPPPSPPTSGRMIRVIIEHFLLPANKQHLGLLDGGRSPSREGARRVRRPHVSNDLELTHSSLPFLSSLV